MSRWTYESITAILDHFTVQADPNAPKEKRRRRIVDAATDLFVEQGYRKTTIAEVAQRAGVAKGTVYLYVRNKGELLLQAIIAEKQRYIVQLKPLFAPQVTARRRLRGWLKLVLTLSHEMPLISRLMGGDREMLLAMQDMPADVMSESGVMQVEMLAQLIDDAAAPHTWAPGELEDRAKVLLGFVHAAIFVSDERMRQGMSLGRYVDIMADILVEGLTAHTRPTDPPPTPHTDGGAS